MAQPSSTTSFFGWARVVFTSNAAGGLIKDWGYDDTGAPILAGVPEPARMLLFMVGAMAMCGRRRRRIDSL